MKTKLTLLALIATMGYIAHGGLYIVSGLDLRAAPIKYVMETTEPNQEVDISPDYLVLFGNWPANTKYAGDWILRTEGNMFTYKYNECINNLNMGIVWTNVPKRTYTYANPGKHLVKMIDDKGNTYYISFTNHQNLVSLSIDLENSPAANQYKDYFRVSVGRCPNLKQLKYRMPFRTSKVFFYDGIIRDLPVLEDLEISHLNEYTNFPVNTLVNCGMTNNIIVDSAIYLGGAFLRDSPRVEYVSMANVQEIKSYCFNCSSTPEATMRQNNWGLKKVRIGDTLQAFGANSFWSQQMMEEVEFVTDEEDWIAAWNNHSLMPYIFGDATPANGQATETTLTQKPASEIPTSIYVNCNRRPTPTKLKVVRRNEL